MSDLDLPLAVRMMQDGYLMEIQDLKEKNEQLRKERDFYFQQVTENGERAHNAIDALNAENAKLRELVAYMHRCYVMGHDWGFYGAPEKEHVEATMRELGVDA